MVMSVIKVIVAEEGEGVGRRSGSDGGGGEGGCCGEGWYGQEA